MKRQLTKTERELEEMGLKRNKEEIGRLENQLAYNESLVEQQELRWAHDDKWRDHIRNNTRHENEQIIKDLRSNVTLKRTNISIAEGHLKDGVEVKNNQTG